MNSKAIEVKSSVDDSFVRIVVHQYERAEPTDLEDANWLTCDVDICARPFSGQVNVAVQTMDLRRFQNELRQKSTGVAKLQTLEGQLDLSIVPIRQCWYRVQGAVKATADGGNALCWSFDVDEPGIESLERMLRELTALYPVRA